MKEIFFFIPMRLPDENQLMALLKKRLVDRSGRTLGSGSLYGPYRKKCLADVSMLMRAYFSKYKLEYPRIQADERCRFRFDWFEADKKRDPDNITAGGRKIILDAMRATGMLKNDGWSSYCQDVITMLDAFHVSSSVGVQVVIQVYQPGEEIFSL